MSTTELLGSGTTIPMSNPIAKKIVGFRKMGIAMVAIGALVGKPPEDFRITVVIGIIAVVGITAQTILDWRNKP